MSLWPFFPNWKTPYRENYAYLTEIIESDSGREQRRAYRVAARRRIEYQALVHKDRFQAIRRFLTDQAQVLTFPDETRRAYTASLAASGTAAMTVIAPPAWIAPAAVLILEDRITRSRVLRTVSTVVGSTVTFTTPSDRDWDAGSRLMPTLTGTMAPSMRAAVVTDQVGDVAVDLDVEPGTEVESVGAAVTTFNGREVLTHRLNWSEGVELESTDPTEWVDYEMGPRHGFQSIDFGTEVYRSLHIATTDVEMNDTLGLFQRCKGRRGEFYAPTHLNDIVLAADVASGAVTWRVAGHDFHAAYSGDTVKKAFAVRLVSGVTLYFRVASMATVSDPNPHSVITTVGAAPYAIALSDIVSVSWMPVCRFVSDDLSLNWITDRTCEIRMNIQTLEDL